MSCPHACATPATTFWRVRTRSSVRSRGWCGRLKVRRSGCRRDRCAAWCAQGIKEFLFLLRLGACRRRGFPAPLWHRSRGAGRAHRCRLLLVPLVSARRSLIRLRSLWGMYRQDARVPVLPPCMMALQVAVGLMLCSGAAAGVACTAGQHQGQQHTLPVHRREQPAVFE